MHQLTMTVSSRVILSGLLISPLQGRGPCLKWCSVVTSNASTIRESCWNMNCSEFPLKAIHLCRCCRNIDIHVIYASNTAIVLPHCNAFSLLRQGQLIPSTPRRLFGRPPRGWGGYSIGMGICKMAEVRMTDRKVHATGPTE